MSATYAPGMFPGLTVATLLLAAPPPLALTADSPIPSRDGGSQRLASAPFWLISERLWALDAGTRTVALDGVEVDVRAASGGLRLSGDSLVVCSVEGTGIQLQDAQQARRHLIDASDGSRVVLEPTGTTTGAQVIAALRLTADAGQATTLSLRGPFRAVDATRRQAIEQTFDERVAELSRCFPAVSHCRLKFVIGPTGRVVQVTVFEPNTDASRCALDVMKTWPFDPPEGGGAIIVSRDGKFDGRPPTGAPR